MKTYRFLHHGRIAEGSEPPAGATLLPPVVPSKIICVGRNYAEHVKELGNEAPGEPVLFFKPVSALLAPGGTIVRPAVSQRVDFEGELAIVVGREAKDVKADRWRDYVRGFTCANDVTARDLQKKDVQFTRGKGFDTFAPIGPCIETDFDPSDVRLTTRVNGETRQEMVATYDSLANAIAPHSTGLGMSSQYIAMPVAIPSPALISVTVPK